MIQTKKEKHLPIVLKKVEAIFDPTLPMWVISSFQYSQIDLTKIMSKISIIRICTFVISGNKNVPIMKDITPIGFPNLTILDLSDNQIQSIESIHRMKFPKISRINLEFNVISKLDSLRKTRLYHLVHLNLGVNKVVTIKPLHYWFSTSIQFLSLKYNQNLTNLSTFILFQLPFECLHLESTGAIPSKKIESIVDSSARFPTRRKFCF